MYSKILKAEFITPCFCGGADQSKPELRTQSIRGQLRWWYRICGATRDEEAELFGSTEKISPLTVRIAKVNLGHEPFNLNDQNNELSTYLWYFLKNQGGRDHQGQKCLPVKTSFDLVLKSREKDLLEKSVAVAALWISLGALCFLAAHSEKSGGYKVKLGSIPKPALLCMDYPIFSPPSCMRIQGKSFLCWLKENWQKLC